MSWEDGHDIFGIEELSRIGTARALFITPLGRDLQNFEYITSEVHDVRQKIPQP